MKKKTPSTKTVATQLGSVLAHLQDGVDQVVALGFKTLKNAGNTKVKKDDSPLKKTLSKTADFLGEAGSSFYEKYEEIKEKRKKK